MRDKDKTKVQLIREVEGLEKKIKELEEKLNKRMQAEIQLRQRTHGLLERAKELNCLYGISSLVEKSSAGLEDVLRGIADLILPSWQYPDITCSRIILEDREFRSLNFRETVWKQSSPIRVYDKLVGAVEVFYLEKKKELDEGPFLKEERGLLIAIAERIGNITERKQAENQIRTLSQQLIQAHESERQIISRELHDRVAQDLSTLKIDIDTLLDIESQAFANTRQKISELSKNLQQAIMAVRNLSYDLRPPSLDQLGPVQAIFQYCEDFAELTGLKVDYASAGMEGLRFDFDTEINLYRLVQEGLNNIRKHAGATHTVVRLVASHPHIILRIEDNGKGFDVKKRLASITKERRMGLRSMQERVNLLGGKVKIQSRLGQGTKISIEVPYKEKKSDSEKEDIDH